MSSCRRCFAAKGRGVRGREVLKLSNLAREKPVQNEQVEGDALSRVYLDLLVVLHHT